MGLNCGCPLGAHITSLEIEECKESFGQIQKVIFQRLYKSTGEKNGFIDNATSVLDKKSWTPFFAASDGTKMTISPYIQNPETEPGAMRTFGGGNQTLGGIEMNIGREPTTFTGVIYQENQRVISQLKTYECEELGVYLIDENGNIGALGTGEYVPTSLYPIPIRSFFVGDKNLGGFEEPDSNAISWAFNPNWSDNLFIIKRSTLDFDPLTELVNVASK